MTTRHALLAALCLTIGACGGGGDDGSPDGTPPLADEPDALADVDPGPGEVGVIAPASDLPVVPPEAVARGTTLRLSPDARCRTVGETFEFAVRAVPPREDGEPEGEGRDVTASVELGRRHGEALELISQGDGAIALRMNERDIAELDLVLPGESSLTVRFGGFAADAPADVLMRKPVEGGCLYALRLGSSFCGTAGVRGGGGAALGISGGTNVEIDGCEYEAPEGLTVIELESDGD